MLRLHALLSNTAYSNAQCNTLLSLHAWFRGAQYIPRVFVSQTGTRDEYAKLLEQLLLTHPWRILQQTQSMIRAYTHDSGLSDINFKNEIIQDIENALEATLGAGLVVYEESRFTPYGHSIYKDAPELLKHLPGHISMARLQKRENARKRAPYAFSHQKPCNPVERSQRAIYEQEWASVWMNPAAYLISWQSEKTIDTLWEPNFEVNACA